MTAALLLTWIVAALLLQLGAAIGFSAWRRGREVAKAPAATQLAAKQPAGGAINTRTRRRLRLRLSTGRGWRR